MHAKKNILLIFLYKEGAGPVFTFEMAKGYAENGCNVYVLLSNKISNREIWENEKIFRKVHFIETGTKNSAINSTLYFYFIERFKLKNLYKEIKFDYIISTFYHPWASTLMNCFSGKKIVICHDPIHHSGVKFTERFLTTLYIKSANEIIVLTKSFIPIIIKRFKFNLKNIHYMPHGRMSQYKKVLHENSYDNKNRHITFLFFGRIEKYKGLRVLSEAYKQIAKTHENIELIIAGSGNLNEYVNDFSNLPNSRIENRYISDEEVGSFFSIPNTVLVLPYLDASQSGVIPIALEYGVPIIASDTGGLREQLDEGKIGYFCKANDIESLKEKMIFIIENPEKINEEKLKIKSYLHKLNWNEIVKPLLSI